MRTVYKYTLAHGMNSVLTYKFAKLLCVQEQGGAICLWAEVDTAFPLESRTLLVSGTGTPLPPGAMLEYVGTAFVGQFVLHVWELLP